ncbi:hypothetical protein [Archangium lansingense]|uniref:HTH cro/C1-type domain-containing protein n=1 Tax=Archangium lansingense TaxID=2995310 RepID=A0ABT4ASF0_9BACT|nr:hypothetical protein [Archangium lansinium]MCY1083784.1 hypothetical protein [Archangium lansinium]
MTTPKWLEPAAARSSQETWTLGHVLLQYRTKRNLTEEDLARELETSVDTLRYLCLCRRPEGPELAQQLATITERFPVPAEKLEAILREIAG